MASVTGGALVVRALRKAGVEKLFGLHGAHVDSIFQACLDDGLPIVDTRHEANAGHAAEGYARASGRLGVAVVTAGGGTTNAITSMANALLDRTPVLYLCGSGALAQRQTNTLQADIDQVALATPVTKWAHQVTCAEQIPRLVAQAVRIALQAPRGPVMLDLPWEVLTGAIADEAAPPAGPAALGSHTLAADDARQIAALIGAAERPVIVVGSEPLRSNAHAAVERLAAATGAPVFADFEGLGLLRGLPEPLFGGLVQGLYGFGPQAPDLVLMAGVRFGLLTGHGGGTLIPHAARTIQIDPDAREIGRLQPVSLGFAADVGPALETLAAAAEAAPAKGDRAAWQAFVRGKITARRELVSRRVEERAGVLHPLRASEIVAEHVSPQVTVAADGALTYLWLSEVIAESRPAAFLCHGQLSSMGCGFGVAVGAQAAADGRRVILVTGDGAVGYSLGEFDTAVRHKLPLIVVVMNNRSWGATLHFQQLVDGPNRITGTRLENGRYEGVAEALGAGAYLASDAASLRAALAAALAKDEPACINVLVDIAPIPPEELILMSMDPFEPPTPA